MISNASFKNFKSWKSFENIKFEKLTAFFGTNSSGKTSIINFFLLLKQTSESTDRAQVLEFGDGNHYTQLGSYNDIIHMHNNNQNLSFSVSIKLPENLEIKDPNTRNKILFKDDELTLKVEIQQQINTRRIFVKELSYIFDNHAFRLYKSREDRYDYTLKSDNPDYTFLRTPGRVWPLPEPEKFYGFPDQIRAYFQNTGFLFDFPLKLEQFLSKIYYLGPLRDYPQRQYTWTGAQPQDMGKKGEKFVDALLASRYKGEKISRGRGQPKFTVEEYVAYWLKELGLIYSFIIDEIAEGSNIYQVKVQKNKHSAPVLITDVGFGVSQVLPVLTLCYYVPEGSILIIEQPEIHLHPKVQAGLADVFVDAIEKKKIQIILESHSEHLLKRLQRRIAEQEFDNSDIAAYFCTNEVNQSKIEKLDVDIFGTIRNWPKDFFGDEMGEMIAMNQAIRERQRN